MEVAATSYATRSFAAGSPFGNKTRIRSASAAKRFTTGIMSASHPSMHSQPSNYSIQSQPSSRSSDTTQGTSQSTLFPPPPPLPNNAAFSHATPHAPASYDVAPTDNIMNSVADASSSLFQICVSLRQRLLPVPGFSDALLEEEEFADHDTDPVTLLWRTFRRGYPLLILYNALRPPQPLTLNPALKEDKRPKAATFKFLQACMRELKFSSEDCFIVTDLYSDDTTGFVKVARVVHRVLDILVQRKLIQDVRPSANDVDNVDRNLKRTQRQHIVAELVTTERTYVQHLELLQAFKHLVEEKYVIPGDAVHDIFLNLNSLLDFQRRFLIRVEQTNALPEVEQNWGKLFLLYSDAFKVYEPYIANQKKCERTVVAEFPKLKDAGGSVEMRQMVESSTSLYGFLMKPFQRLSKYPLLLDDLHKKGDLDEERKADLLAGKVAATSVLSRTNKAVDREEKAEAVQELKARVEDWKGHRVEAFGELLLYGTFTVLKSENLSSGKDAERQYHVYLFETILLCCKDIDLSKPKNKLATKQLVDKKGKPKLQLKGRIFMQNVTDLISLTKPGSYTCQIFWKGDPSIENFVIRFQTEEMMKRWAHQLEAQRRKHRERDLMNSASFRANGTSETEFEFMRNQPIMENPYARQAGEEDDDDDDDGETYVASSNTSWASQHYALKSDFSQSRNASQSSLRSRSTTGESGIPPPSAAAQSRALPPRMQAGSIPPPGHPSLSLRTQPLASPGDRGPGESYFSPSGDSPASSIRTSSSSTVYSFPRQQHASNGYYHEENHHPQARFTAPAMARPAVSREPSAPVVGTGGYGPAPPRGTSGPRGMHSAQAMPPPRNRSASSPDIHQNQRGLRRVGTQPPIPDIPAPHQSYVQPSHMVPRNQTSSPSLPNGTLPPPRGSSQSPNSQRGEGAYAQRQDDNSPTSNYAYYNARGAQSATSLYPATSRGVTTMPSMPRAHTFSPSSASSTPPPTSAPAVSTAPTQLKVKVHCPSASQVLTLVVPVNITYSTLKDRIDAKLQRSTNLTLGSGVGSVGKDNVVKLKYLDEEDFVTIQTDEDVQEAFDSWSQQGEGGDTARAMGEVELFCQR